MKKYKNTFFQKFNINSKEFFDEDLNKEIYRGHEIHRRWNGDCHVVTNDVCIAMRAGKHGARRAIDELINKNK